MKWTEALSLGLKLQAAVAEARSLIVTAIVGDRVDVPSLKRLKWFGTRGHLELVYVVDRAATP